jgi:Uma2 family endonuclease
MSAAVSLFTPMRHLPLRVRSAHALSDDALFELCSMNRDLRIERTKDGELLIMPPTGGKTGARSFALTAQLGTWVGAHGGIGFDSSTGFVLPNTAERSPDLAWIRQERWDALTDEQKEKFVPLAPDFVVELRSKSDDLDELMAKMEEYRDNGVLLGWLVDPYAQRAYVFRPGADVEDLEAPTSLDASPTLPGFVLSLSDVWAR